jgi:hypothetical protein
VGDGWVRFYTDTAATTAAGTDVTPTERLRIDSSGNVGIGTSIPSSFYSLADNLVVGTGSGGNGLTVYSGSADSGYIGFNDTASASMQGFIQYNHSGDYMAFAPNGGEKMRIDSAGRVTMPYQPCFTAYKTSGNDSGPTDPVIFNATHLNVGNHYNTSTGKFTAPVTGNYMFIGSIDPTSTGSISVQFVKNGVWLSANSKEKL